MIKIKIILMLSFLLFSCSLFSIPPGSAVKVTSCSCRLFSELVGTRVIFLGRDPFGLRWLKVDGDKTVCLCWDAVLQVGGEPVISKEDARCELSSAFANQSKDQLHARLPDLFG